MKKLALYCCILLSVHSLAQTKGLHLKNALIITHMNNQEDRFSLEVATAEVFSNNGIKSAVSLNMLKQGGNPDVLIGDSVTQLLAAKGINTVVLVSIRGYDRRFKISEKKLTLKEDIAADNLFSLYKDEVVSVSVEFHFYRNGLMVGSDLIKIGGISSRDGVVKKYRKKLSKQVRRHWK